MKRKRYTKKQIAYATEQVLTLAMEGDGIALLFPSLLKDPELREEAIYWLDNNGTDLDDDK
jgi:hypothetical protein